MQSMSQDDLKKTLLAKQKELTSRLKQLKKEASREDNPVSADFEEQAVEREGDDVIEEISRVAQIELNEIRVALERFKTGTYGICAECGDNIPIKRLEAIPMAMFCTDCQEDIDDRNR